MLILLSPAKTMDFSNPIPVCLNNSEPVFLKNALFLNKILKKMDSDQLKTALKISDKQIIKVESSISNFKNTDTLRPAIYAYRGAVYKEIETYSLNKEQLLFSQKHIRILSGLYGIIRPLDLINEYRLDMKSAINIPNFRNLYEYWKDIITDYFIKYYSNKILLNLASLEFSKMIDFTKINSGIIDISFSEFKNNKLISPPMYSKMARGKMTGFIIKNLLISPEQIKRFDLDGYSFNNKLSSEKKYIFTR